MSGLSVVAAGGGLGNSGKDIPLDEFGHDQRRVSHRYWLRDAARKIWLIDDDFRSLRLCGLAPIVTPDGEAVQLRMWADTGTVGVGGVVSCGNVRLCPVCASRVLGRRRDEVLGMLASPAAHGTVKVFVTMTLRHSHEQGPKQQKLAVSAAWKASVSQGRAAMRLKAAGLMGTIRSIETQLCGPSGAHTHVHAIMVFAEGTTRGIVDAELGKVRERWERRAMAEMDGLRPSAERGVNWKMARDMGDVASYLTKVCDEVTRTDTKIGRNGSLSPLQLLHEVVMTGDATLFAVLLEYARETKGTRSIVVSSSLRKALAVVEDVSDEEIAAEEPDGAVIIQLTGSAWAALVKAVGTVHVLETARIGGCAAVRELLFRVEAPPD